MSRTRTSLNEKGARILRGENMRIQIENESFVAEINPVGAELKRLYWKNEDQELLWQGEEGIWSGSSPWLFPFVGRLKDDGYCHQGKRYAMIQHGFARKATFEAEKHGDAEAVFVLRESEDSMKCYPWRFVLRICYRLTNDGLRISCAVQNADEAEMYFSLGAHPGFVCEPGDKLVFNQTENTGILRLDPPTHLLVSKPEGMFDGSELSLSPELFDKDAIILKDLSSTAVTLVRQNGMRIRVEFGEIAYLGLWSRAGANLPYICVEPWFGVDDLLEADGELRHKEAIQSILPGKSFEQKLEIVPSKA